MSTSNNSNNSKAALLTTIGLMANSIVIGAPVWVFFLQSPALFAFMGRSKFLPPMMRLTKLLFRWTLVVSAAVVLMTEVINDSSSLTTTTSTQFAALSLAAALVNAVVIVPRALAAGAKATLKKDDEVAGKAHAKDMAISGGDPSQASGTKFWHQTVVVFVVVMLIGSVGYIYNIVAA